MVSARKRVLLTGNCEYELLGLLHLLSDMGCEVLRPEMSYGGTYNLIVVALSAGPLVGWGRYLRHIRLLRAANTAPMVVLVPPRLQGLRLLRGMARVFCGRSSLARLRAVLGMVSGDGADTTPSVGLTRRQTQALMNLRLAVSSNASLKVVYHRDYYLRARLVERVGVDNLHVLCASGLLSEVSGWQE